jgi:hypothetical protein
MENSLLRGRHLFWFGRDCTIFLIFWSPLSLRLTSFLTFGFLNSSQLRIEKSRLPFLVMQLSFIFFLANRLISRKLEK